MKTNNSLLTDIQTGIQLFNEGSDNTEYLRGQVELGMYLLGYVEEEQRKKLIEGLNNED
jgi:hypothetical protein